MSSNRVIDGSSIFTGNDVGKDQIKKEFGVCFNTWPCPNRQHWTSSFLHSNHENQFCIICLRLR